MEVLDLIHYRGQFRLCSHGYPVNSFALEEQSDVCLPLEVIEGCEEKICGLK